MTVTDTTVEIGSEELAVDHRAYRRAASRWFEDNGRELAPFRLLPSGLEDRVEHLVRLRRLLWDGGVARYGWPVELGGFGGDPRHRGILLEQLARRGFPPPLALDHLEIIAPTLAEFLPAEQATALVAPTLRAELLWCQGFSEPDAGSDLTSLKTRATRTATGWRLEGQKIWTSWTSVAHRCLVLARTGEGGSRGLTMFHLPVESPGLTHRPIMQANGQPEFSEVFFDGVDVSHEGLVGEPGQGWEVARFLLSCERGAYAWQRHGWLARWLGDTLDAGVDGPIDHERMLDAATHLLALRALSRRTLRAFAEGERPGPNASIDKALLSRSELLVFDAIRVNAAGAIELGVAGSEIQELYLASRMASVYGGAREIQLNLVAQRLMGLPRE